MNFSGIEVDRPTRPTPAQWEMDAPPPPPKPTDLGQVDTEAAADYRRRYEEYMEQLAARPPTLEEIMYAVNSFAAVMWPVALTMIFSSILVVVVDDGTNGDGAGGTATLPTPYIKQDGDSTSDQFVGAVLNALSIIGVIVGTTFAMVALYYFKLMKFLVAYLMAAAFMLLAFTTGFVATTAYQVYSIPMDAITHWIFFANFAACGVIAIFYQKGIPKIVNQAYIITMSVTMAWLLLRLLPEWTSWALLVFLACYDLCAVLTPCGPLKCLVEMAQASDDPLPGLLYEADVRENPHAVALQQQLANRPHLSNGNDSASASSSSSMNDATPPSSRPATRGAVRSSSPPPPPADVEAGEHQSPVDRIMDPEHSRPRQPSVVIAEGEEILDRSIKLGLGDFVFYSVLVGRAALYSFPTMIAVLVTVLFGLASTLILLSVFKKALPALPISIFIGVAFYFLTELAVSQFSNYLIVRTMFV